MSGEQIVGLHNAALQSGSPLEEGLRCLEEDYRGELETRDDILHSLSLGLEVLLKLTLWLFGESGKSIGRSHNIPELLDQLLPLVPSGSMPPGRREFLESDPRFRELLEILGRYGGAGKYKALDAALERSTKRRAGPVGLRDVGRDEVGPAPGRRLDRADAVRSRAMLRRVLPVPVPGGCDVTRLRYPLAVVVVGARPEGRTR